MIEPDSWLHTHAPTLGVNPRLINPASVDLILGREVVMMEEGMMGATFTPPEGQACLLLRPGRLYLLCSEERIHVPPTHAAQLLLKSSRKRQGLINSDVGWIDPGYEGQLTMPVTVPFPVVVTPGERFAQLVFMRLTAPADQPYQGRYQGSTGPTAARRDV